jgi:hypothetical protein
VDKQTLLAAGRLPEDDVQLPGVGTVRVRGLTRKELLELRVDVDKGLSIEQRMLAFGMVDPALSPEEAVVWQQISPANEIEMVTDAIGRLTGLGQGATKSHVPGV